MTDKQVWQGWIVQERGQALLQHDKNCPEIHVRQADAVKRVMFLNKYENTDAYRSKQVTIQPTAQYEADQERIRVLEEALRKEEDEWNWRYEWWLSDGCQPDQAVEEAGKSLSRIREALKGTDK